LLDAGHFDGAYYLAGYAIECALKACMARQTREFDFPDRNIVNQMYVHDPTKLMNVAGLEADVEAATQNDEQLRTNWAIVKGWSEEARYARYSEEAARQIIDAVANRDSGVLAWLRLHW